MVAYYYPPAGGAGVQRTLKFTRYLPSHGWRPHLVVPANPDYPVTDPFLEAEVPPEVVRHEARILEPYAVYRRLTGRRGSLDVASLTRSDPSWSERLSEWIRATVFVPDARIGWYPFAVRTGSRVLRETRASIIYTTAPPYTAHVIGLTLHRRTGLPWVADFRDSWVDWLSAPSRAGLSRRWDLTLEGAVLAEATAVVTVSDGVAEDLRSRHPAITSERFVRIPNGFDPADLADPGGASPRVGPAPGELPAADGPVIVYSGTLYGPRDPETLIHGLERLAADGHAAAATRVRLIGRVDDAIADRIARSTVAGAVDRVGYVDHATAIAELRAADVALLVVDQTPHAPGILTGKLFEYLGLGKPILALAAAGEATRLIESLDAGAVVAPGDVDAMCRALVDLHQRWVAGTLRGARPEAVAAYSRPSQARQLAELFDRLTPSDTTVPR